MTWLILEMVLALGVIVGIMVWTMRSRTDTPLDLLPPEQKTEADKNKATSHQATDSQASNNATHTKPSD